jgi:flagellar hook assembly protein FlgD
LFNFLENVVPNKNYVMIMTMQDAVNHYRPEQWKSDSVTVGDKNLFNYLEKQGAKQIRRTVKEGAKPYYFLYRKNDPSFAVEEMLADSANQIISNNHNVSGLREYGEVSSALVGPVKSWEKVFWKYSKKEKNDLVALDVIGVKADKKTETVIYKNITVKDTALSGIDAKIYPYLKLRYRSSDSTLRTSPQLDYWRIHYQPLPEIALDPSVYVDFYLDTLQQGENMRIGMGIKNISTQKMDSVLVRFNIKDENNNEITQYKRYKAIGENDTIKTSLTLNTRNLSGKQQVTIEANPKLDHPEQYHFNNIGIKNFYVKRDIRNPLLDVTFDGQHILNGDIVSSKPNILISVRDENKFLLLNDTSKFAVLLRGPKDSVATPISLSSGFVKFIPASSTKENVAKIELSPTLPQDGNYTLLVRARDASDNHTSDLLVSDIQQNPIFKDKYNYKIDFQVINKTSISNVLNYPNPFSTHTQFVYTLTGSSTPDFFKIQIMTISGKVVREITQDEIGPLRIGTHRTEYTWNGTDEFGDKLANGVYLYRIVTQKTDGSAYEKYDNNTDTYFKNGFGKMVILR